MNKFSLFHPLALAFYSRALCVDVAKNWRGLAIWYPLLLLAICWVFETASTYFAISHSIAEAAEKCESALKLRDSDYAVWGNLAAACRNISERSSEAMGFYERAVELAEARRQVNPRDIETAIHLADYYLELERYEDGRRLLQTALQLDMENPDLLARLGILYEKLGDRKEAIVWILKALKSGYPRDRLEALNDLGELRNDAEFQHRLRELEVPD